MKKSKHVKHLLLLTAIAVGFAACKKSDPEPQPAVPVEAVSLSIEDLKKLSTTASVTINEENKIFRIKGIVISDKDAKNIDAKTVVLQEGDGKPGIIINFAAAHNFALGDEVQVGVSNQKLEQVNGEIVLNAVPLDSISKTGTGTITARTATAAEITNTNNAAVWNGTLVTLSEGTFSGSNGAFSGTLTYTDATGTVNSTVQSDASFQGDYYPLNVKNLTGIVRINGDEVRVDLRRVSDAESVNAYTLIEDFQSLDAVSGVGAFVTLPSGKWDLVNQSNIVVVGGLDADKGFLEAGRKYLYTPYPQLVLGGKSGGVTPHLAPAGFPDPDDFHSKLEGLSSISATFAGSLITSFPEELTTNPPSGSRWNAGWTFRAFNPSSDYYAVTFEVVPPAGNFTGNYYAVARFTDLGQFHTVTFTIPTTKEELEQWINDNGQWWDDEAINAFVANPAKQIKLFFNSSSRSSGYGTGQQMGTPMIIQKIEFGYKTKPSWAN